VKLTDSDLFIGSVRTAINVKAAASADSFPAIMVKGNRLFIPEYQFFIQNIKHLQKRTVGRYVADLIIHELSFRFGIFLTPDF
jgi:hypothetical protein